MSKKFLSLALALTICLGLTIPALADSAYDYSVIYLADGEEDSVYHCNCSANGYTDPSAENVTFSMAPHRRGQNPVGLSGGNKRVHRLCVRPGLHRHPEGRPPPQAFWPAAHVWRYGGLCSDGFVRAAGLC